MAKFRGFIRGAGIGIAAGVAIGAVGSALIKNNKGVRKNAGKALRAVGDLVENVQYMVK